MSLELIVSVAMKEPRKVGEIPVYSIAMSVSCEEDIRKYFEDAVQDEIIKYIKAEGLVEADAAAYHITDECDEDASIFYETRESPRQFSLYVSDNDGRLITFNLREDYTLDMTFVGFGSGPEQERLACGLYTSLLEGDFSQALKDQLRLDDKYDEVRVNVG